VKKINIAISLEGLVLVGEDKGKTSPKIFCDMVKNIILMAASQKQQAGLGEDDRRVYYKICDKFDAAIKSGAIEIEFEDAEYKMIKDAKKIHCNPNDLFRRVEEAISE
jgi:hypothetical protein